MITDFMKEIDGYLLQWIQAIVDLVADNTRASRIVLQELDSMIRFWEESSSMGNGMYFDQVCCFNFAVQYRDRLSNLIKKPIEMFYEYINILDESPEVRIISDSCQTTAAKCKEVDKTIKTMGQKLENLKKDDLEVAELEELCDLGLKTMEYENLFEKSLKQNIMSLQFSENLLEDLENDFELDQEREDLVIKYKMQLNNRKLG
mmetsp:Transcript_14816/g.13023  ORF Transcript_14816/g.13023 Transcript_14816/m.13023 type:complete len:204 (+) Transcript_14816:284-895(+)